MQVGLYSDCMTKGGLLLTRITNEKPWHWANNESMTQALRDALKQLENTTDTNTMIKELITRDFDAVKKAAPPEKWAESMRDVIASLKSKTEACLYEIKVLNEMHACRLHGK